MNTELYRFILFLCCAVWDDRTNQSIRPPTTAVFFARGSGTIPRRVYTDPNDLAEDYEVFQKALGKRLKELRRDRGFSLRDMTVLHGYAESQWRRMEREGVATMQSLLRIAKAFQTTVADLTGGLGQYPKVAVKVPSRKTSLKNATDRIATWNESSTELKLGQSASLDDEGNGDPPPLLNPKVAK